MNSMTGYAYEEISNENYSLSVEIKSVNSRFLELTINMPSYMNRLETRFRELITSKISRGKIDIYLKIKELNSVLNVDVNTKAAVSYSNALKKIARAVGIDESAVTLSLISSQEGVLISQKEIDIEYYWNVFFPVFSKALEKFISDRKREGENLKTDLLKSLSYIENARDVFLQYQSQMETIFKENIIKRFHEMLGDNLDEQRIMQETASLLIKYTINEEIVRLTSHINALKNEINDNPLPGKKMDFICQEMNREINTIGSKNQIIEAGKAVIAAKDALENIREQARNVE
jgi:uncharacterized protein (TIGR00255 family)